MATITSAQSGDWSIGTTWVGGVVPTAVDAAVIATGHTVTLDSTTCECNTLSITGTFTASTTTSSRLTFITSITVNSGGQVNIDVSSNPTVVCELLHTTGASEVIFVTHTTGVSTFILKGAPKKRWTTLTSPVSIGATSASLVDTTGWLVGDTVVFGTTDPNNPHATHDIVTVTSVSEGSISWSGGLSYAHGTPCYVANMSSNMILRSTGGTSSVNRRVEIYVQSDVSSRTKKLTDVLVTGLSGTYQGAIKFISNYWQSDADSGAYSCAFYNNWGFSLSADIQLGSHGWEDNAFFTMNDHSVTAYRGAAWIDCSQTNGRGVRRNLFLRHTYKTLGGGTGGNPVARYIEFTENVFAGCASISGIEAHNSVWRNNRYDYMASAGMFNASGIHYNSNFAGAGFASTYRILSKSHNSAKLINCIFPPDTNLLAQDWVSTLGTVGTPDSTIVEIVNKNGDVTLQEIWGAQSRTKPVIARDNSVYLHGTSSLKFSHGLVNKPVSRSQQIPCSNGQTIRIVGYVRINSLFYNAGDCNYPTVTLSGLGVTPVSFTATSAANEAWQKYDLSITNSSGVDGEFTLTMSASAKTVTTGTVYFDGIPDSPFITKVRHYGFEFDETNPTRKVNPYTVADESTAAAYTGVTINPTTERVTFGVGTADTFQKVYDYSQAWGASNIDKEMPWTRAGALLAINSGWIVADPSITGVTWGSGVIEFNSPGSISGSFDSCTLRFNTVGTYDLSNGLFSGTIQLVNTSPGQVIVIVLPSGIDYVNTDPMNITVQVAVQQATGSITGIVPGSRLQIYNETTATEMVNQIIAGTSYTVNYPTGTGYSAGNIVRVRLTYCNGLSAKLPVEYKTVASSAGWSFLADQKNDEVYILNGIDGSTVTEYTADYLNVQIDLADGDGSTTIQRGYAWYCDQMTGDQGIALYFNAMYAEDTLNYVLNTDVLDIKIQNTNMSTGVVLTGGALRRKDGSSPIAPGGSIYIYYGRTYSVETGVSGLTPTESDKLLSLPDATTVSNSVWSHAFTNKLLTLAKFLSNK